ncbi:hypothetical protein [Roseisolibacter agri]|uniref:Carboxypeptidase regulatory-like domain-containing protein n=1 Tax=Roseisolibacter agri TaxID=2014610 RepID=A0AA37QCC1_9BACT|nr:hypothetical protein [Roseisolibacter agri]GLC23670.1 hypothetical protein rosag_01830 [Roseisolibacter agri]
MDGDGAAALAAGPGTPTAGVATADTSRATNLPSSVRIEGRVLLPGASDSTQLVAAPGAKLTLYRNQMVDGQATTTKVAEATAGADASYAFDGVPGGYYVLSVDVTASRFWGSHVAFILADAPVVRVTVPFWRRP